MKNLKKVLALVLVVAMMASFAVGASAAFKDADKITYTTAVDVLTGLGVINGYADGTFRATDSVTRGAFTKMTAYVMNGGVNAAASYGTYAAASFKDVAANSTFGNSIGYCTNKRIISGYTDGTFRAGNKVTGVQAAKMLLGALGYDSKIEGYTGSAWAKNVLADAEDAGLFKGMASVDLTQPLTREAAAQMIWNALQATMVKYSNSGVTITTPDGTTVNTGASAAQEVTTTEAFGKQFSGETGAGPYTVQLVEKYFDTFKNNGVVYDELGRPATQYVVQTNKPVATVAIAAAKTYTTAVADVKLYADLGLNAETAIPTVTNTKTGSAAGTFTAKRVNATPATIGGNGKIVEVYQVGQNSYRIVVLVPSLLQVSDVKNVAATKTVGAYTQYTFGSSVSHKVYTSVVAGTEKSDVVIDGTIAKNDYVLYYAGTTKTNGTAVDGDKVGYVATVGTVSGNVTSATSQGVYTVGGTAYELSAAYSETSNATTYVSGSTVYPKVDTKNESSFYVDANNYIVGIKKATAAEATYVYVVKAEVASSLVNNRLTSTLVADAVFTDGTNKEITISKINDTPVADPTATAGATKGLYQYVQDKDGNYQLSDVASPAVKTDLNGKSISNKNPAIDTLYANNATKYVYITTVTAEGPNKGKTSSVKTATGYTNSVATTAKTGSYAVSTNNIVNVVYVVDAAAAGATANYVYYLGTYTDYGTYKAYDFIVNGEKTTINDVKNLSSAGMVTITDGKANPAAVSKVDGEDMTSISYNAGLLVEKSATKTAIVAVNDNVPVYTISASTKDVVPAEVSSVVAPLTGTAIYVSTNETGVIVAIYVVVA